VAALLGAAGRARAATIVFPLAEVAMTLAGLALGFALPWGHVAGGLVLIGVGVWMLFEDEGKAASTRPLLALAVGISLDELAIGVSLGLLGVSAALAVALVAAQAVVASQLGVRLGARVRGEVVERVAAATLIVLGAAFALL
jgi:manganese efflux pump family protein